MKRVRRNENHTIFGFPPRICRKFSFFSRFRAVFFFFFCKTTNPNAPRSHPMAPRRGVGVLHKKQDVQPWRRIPFCEGHYRLDYPLFDAIYSLFYWHNETLNIWTHVLGFCFFLWFTFYSLDGFLKEAEFGDRVLHGAFLVSIQVQMICSATHHWFGCMIRPIYYLTARLDYSAIAFLLPIANALIVYSLFYCENFLFWLYSLLNIFCGLLVMGLCWWPTFQTPSYQKIRALSFSLLGLFGALPWSHIFFRDPSLFLSPTFVWQMITLAVMGTGVGVYISRYPERAQPGKWDCCQSHCFWHIFVVIGNLFQCYCSEELYYLSMSRMRPCLA